MKAKVIEILEKELLIADRWIRHQKTEIFKMELIGGGAGATIGDADFTLLELKDQAVAKRDEIQECLDWVAGVE